MAKKIAIKTRVWDPARYLTSEAMIADYISLAFEDGDPRLVALAVGDAARARGMTKIAKKAGLGRESLYKALSAEGNPEFATILKVMRALGFTLKAAPLPVRKTARGAAQKRAA